MSIAAALQAGVGAIRQALQSGGMLVTVQREAFDGVNDNGRDVYADPVSVPGVLFEDTDARVVTFKGVESVVRARITLLDPMVVSIKDRWTTPDGRKMIARLVTPGVVPANGQRIVTEVMLG